MRPEHLATDLEQKPSLEQSEYKFEDMESERPFDFELPSLESKSTDNSDTIEWNGVDSERETVELPHLKSENLDEAKELLADSSCEVRDNTEISNEQTDTRDGYYSTYEERIKQTPRDDSGRGEWSGERGESNFTSNDEEIKELLDKNGVESISYKDGIPDFSEVSEATVEIDNMTENRAENFKQCDEKCAEQWNKGGRDGRTDWAARDVKAWRKESDYTWHERNNMKTCDLVPTKVNDYFGHLGGVSECKKRDVSESGGSDFDE